MLKIKTYIKDVEGKGVGLFSTESLPLGKVWHIDELEFDKEYSLDFVKENGLLDYFYHYATFNKEKNSFYLCSDNARFINHSDTPNTWYDKENGHCVTTKVIEAGEEITCDYRNICDDSKYNGFDFEVK